MAKIVILGAGIAGHTAAAHLRRKLNHTHEILVISPNRNYQWVPSNIWVGIGKMKSEDVSFALAPIYKKNNINYKQAKVFSFHPDGDEKNFSPYVTIEFLYGEKKGEQEQITYDYLINATGPKLAFELTEGLLPGKNKTYSVCTYEHASQAAIALKAVIANAKKSTEKLNILIGTGHPKATCQGAAFEYILNVEKELVKNKVRDKITLTWISNEYELGDFGMDGMLLTYGNKNMLSSDMVEMVFRERGINWILGAGVSKIEDGLAYYEKI